MNKILEAAESYAGRGLRVAPLNPYLKTPVINKWQLEATTNLNQIRSWFNHGNKNVAIVTGAGVVVVDVDAKNGVDGYATLKELEKQHGPLPSTDQVKTPSGGTHLYYKYPETHIIKNSVSKLGAGIDIRAEGGYVVAPPSMLDSSLDPEGKIVSGRYEWLNTRAGFADLPPAWLELLAYKAKGSQPPKNTPPTYDTHDPDLAEVQDALSALSPDLSYDEWIKIGAALYHSLGEQGFSVWDAWSQRGTKYQAAGMRGKWASFKDNPNPAKLSSLFFLAQQKGWQNPRKGQHPQASPKPSTPAKPKAATTAPSPLTVLDAALEQAEGGDISALQSDTVLSAFIQLRATDELAYQRYRSQVQALKGKVKPFALLGWINKPSHLKNHAMHHNKNRRMGKIIAKARPIYSLN